MKYLLLFIGFYLCLLFCSCTEQGDSYKNPVTSADYSKLTFPSFKTVRILYLKKNLYDSIFDPVLFDSFVSKKIIRGAYGFFTFLDSLGNPLSHNCDSVVLNKEQSALLVGELGTCYAKNNPGFPKCGEAIQDAVVFYDSTDRPCGFIEIGFGCHVYSFSKSIKVNTDECNTDSMMKKFVDLFNAFGIKRSLAY